MTDTQPQPIDLATWVQRSTGVSREDAERIVTRITTEAYAQWTAQQAAAPPPEPDRLQPINITFTAEIDTKAIIDAVAREMWTAETNELREFRKGLA